jgi:hypothetical protein
MFCRSSLRGWLGEQGCRALSACAGLGKKRKGYGRRDQIPPLPRCAPFISRKMTTQKTPTKASAPQHIRRNDSVSFRCWL